MECHLFCIVLSVPPKITPFSFGRDLNVGDRTSIQCVVATGDLPLTFTWLKDNASIEVSSDQVTSKKGGGDRESPVDRPGKTITVRQFDEFNSALSIGKIAPVHNGTYTCRVANDAATVAHSALLNVNGNQPLVFFSKAPTSHLFIQSFVDRLLIYNEIHQESQEFLRNSWNFYRGDLKYNSHDDRVYTLLLVYTLY